MMWHNQVDRISDSKFRRFNGIKKETYFHIVEIIKEADKEKKALGGRKNKLSTENQVLLLFKYYRQYVPYFHIGHEYGVSESTAFRIIRWVEEVLAKHPDFKLPGKHTLKKDYSEDDVILIDVTETPIERPKKNKKNTIRERKKDIR